MNSKNTKPKTQLTDSKIQYFSSFVEIENFNNVVRQTTPLNLLHLLFAAFMALYLNALEQ
jgi:hypothetical protein